MTPFALLLDVCGLSHREAAELHGVRIDTVKSWASGRNRAPAGVIEQLRRLAADIHRGAAEAAYEIVLLAQREVELGYPADDHEARELGLPCVGAWRAMAGLMVARLDANVRLVPRGSTPATAAAIEAREGARRAP